MLYFSPLLRRVLLVLFVLGCFAVEVQAQSTDEPAPTETTQVDELEEAKEAYQQKFEERQSTERKIDDIFSNLAIGNPKERTKQLKEIEELQMRLPQLTIEVYEAAVHLAEVTPAGSLDRKIQRVTLEYCKACVGGNKHIFPINPVRSLEVCEVLKEGGFPATNLLPLEIHAAISIQDFEYAKTKINAVSESGVNGLEPLMDQVNQAEEKWIRESGFRAEEKDLPRIRMTTSHGDITFVLFEDNAPNAVRNFVSLIDKDFYDGHQFFEIKRGQLVRCGCPENNGSSSGMYKIANEASQENARHHFPGTLSMVTDDAQTACCHQFVITQVSTSHLDGNFPVIGRIIEGQEILDKIVQSAISETGDSKPKINSIEVLYRRPGSNYRPNKMEDN